MINIVFAFFLALFQNIVIIEFATELQIQEKEAFILSYSTKQRRLLLDYLSNHTDEKLSARQIAFALSHEDISLSAVYRNLSALEKTGAIKRSEVSNSREVFYQYIDSDHCKEHLHLSCNKCGKIFHMNAKDSNAFIKIIAENEMFAVDRARTVVYGICKNCQNSPAL